jgi:hypothetical protein
LPSLIFLNPVVYSRSSKSQIIYYTAVKEKSKMSHFCLNRPRRETAVPAALILDKRNTKDPENRAKEALWLKNSM